MKSYNENPILKLTLSFSIDIVRYCDQLQLLKKYVIASQLLRAATSIGANAREAQNAESKPDFIHKFKVAAKEADETEYWLIICSQIDGYPDCIKLIEDVKTIQRILNKIIGSSKSAKRLIS